MMRKTAQMSLWTEQWMEEVKRHVEETKNGFMKKIDTLDNFSHRFDAHVESKIARTKELIGDVKTLEENKLNEQKEEIKHELEEIVHEIDEKVREVKKKLEEEIEED